MLKQINSKLTGINTSISLIRGSRFKKGFRAYTKLHTVFFGEVIETEKALIFKLENNLKMILPKSRMLLDIYGALFVEKWLIDKQHPTILNAFFEAGLMFEVENDPISKGCTLSSIKCEKDFKFKLLKI